MMRTFIVAGAISVASVLAAPSAPPLTTKPIATTPVCSSAVYSYFLPLSKVPIAESWCSSKYPVALVTSTATAPAVTVSTTVATTTTTVTITTFDYTTVATKPTTVFTRTQTVTVPVVKTTTVTAQAFSKRAISSINYSSRPAILLNSLYTSLTAQATNFASTLCSCIESPAATTSTVTVTPTTTVDLFATTTVTLTQITAHVSVTASTTINAITTVSVSSTTTTTVIVAASPTNQAVCTLGGVTATAGFQYNQKFVGSGLTSGPYNAGNDVPDFAPPITTPLPNSAISDCDAITQCVNIAANESVGPYFTVVVYQLISTGVWNCQQFFDPTFNPSGAQDVATPNADVRVVYEYTLN